MKIIYKQGNSPASHGLAAFGVSNCYFKQLSLKSDIKSITKKSHHHTGFEMHIITDGFQEYCVGKAQYKLKKGDFLLICPGVSHKALAASSGAQKISLTFTKEKQTDFACFFGKLSARMADDIAFALKENTEKKEISQVLTEGCILEIIVAALRMAGLPEEKAAETDNCNAITALAKQYIADNIEKAPTVAEAARYCGLGVKQFTRAFKRFEHILPSEYIIKKRILAIEALLSEGELSLKQISEITGFGNEYCFNSFFKKYAGMPPGEYRKAVGK